MTSSQCQFSIQRRHWLSDPKAHCPAGAHHQSASSEPRRRGAGPILRVCDGVCSGGEAGEEVGWDRHLGEGGRAGEHTAAGVHGRPVPQPAGHCQDGHSASDGYRGPDPVPEAEARAVWPAGGEVWGMQRWSSCSGYLTVDHVVPRSLGEGRTTQTTLQLLCPNCNRVKGDRDMAYLVARLGERVGGRGQKRCLKPVRSVMSNFVL